MAMQTGQLDAMQFDREISGLADRFASDPLTDALKACREVLFKAFGDNFRNQASPGGSPWPARKDPRPSHPLLILTGALFQSVTSSFGEGHVERIGNREMEVGTALPYSAAQNFGYPERNIAQREYMGIDDTAADELAGVLSDYVQLELVG